MGHSEAHWAMSQAIWFTAGPIGNARSVKRAATSPGIVVLAAASACALHAPFPAPVKQAT